MTAGLDVDPAVLHDQSAALDRAGTAVAEGAARLAPSVTPADLPGFGLVDALTGSRDQWRGELEGLGDRCAVAAAHLVDSANAYRAGDQAAAEGFWVAVR